MGKTSNLHHMGVTGRREKMGLESHGLPWDGPEGRVINERIAAHQSLGRGEKMAVVCECEDGDCQVRIELTWQDYEEVRKSASSLVVTPGHERPGKERIIRREQAWMIVERLPEAG